MSSHGQEDSASPQLDTFLILTFQQENILKTVEIICKSSEAIAQAVNHKSATPGLGIGFGLVDFARIVHIADMFY